MSDKPIFKVLNKGGVICYSPCSGGLVLLDNAGTPLAGQLSVPDFLRLRHEGQIKHTGSMRQGHHVFHGQVDFYKLPIPEDALSGPVGINGGL